MQCRIENAVCCESSPASRPLCYHSHLMQPYSLRVHNFFEYLLPTQFHSFFKQCRLGLPSLFVHPNSIFRFFSLCSLFVPVCHPHPFGPLTLRIVLSCRNGFRLPWDSIFYRLPKFEFLFCQLTLHPLSRSCPALNFPQI